MNRSPATAAGKDNVGTTVFVHVPKAAGTTLCRIIQRHHAPDRTMVFDGEYMVRRYRELQTLPEEERRQLLCLMGHIPFGVHRWLPQGARYLTMVRHPVDWTLSLHSYIKRMEFFETNPDFAAFRGARDLDIDGFAEFLLRSNMADWQTRQIGGESFPTLLPPYPPMNDEALERAKRTLRTDFECVGVVEQFDESLLLMKRRFGWRNICYRQLNVSDDRVTRRDLPRATVERILACHRRDVALYEEARRILAEQVAQAGDEFQRDLRRFRRVNALYRRLLPAYEASGLHRVRDAVRRALAAVR